MPARFTPRASSAAARRRSCSALLEASLGRVAAGAAKEDGIAQAPSAEPVGERGPKDAEAIDAAAAEVDARCPGKYLVGQEISPRSEARPHRLGDHLIVEHEIVGAGERAGAAREPCGSMRDSRCDIR